MIFQRWKSRELSSSYPTQTNTVPAVDTAKSLWKIMAAIGIIPLIVWGCVSPVALHRAAIEYDRSVSRIETELLLLNIARHRHYHPIHFTAVSSIAASFNFTVSSGVSLLLADNPGTGSHAGLTLGASASENPTITMVPLQGEEFTKRILTSIHSTKVAFLAHQGFDLAIILRLLAHGITLNGYGESGFLLNAPNQIEEYSEFRRRVLHLSALRRKRQLWVQEISFHGNSSHVMGLVLITNYDPMGLRIEEQKALQQEAETLPRSSLLVDIRPGYLGGDYPLRGAIELRSFNNILYFVGQGIAAEPEFNVDKDPRTGPIGINPSKTMYIRETEDRPDDAVFVVEESGFWYSLEPMPHDDPLYREWNRKAFDILYKLFQMTVTDVSQTHTPTITIAK